MEVMQHVSMPATRPPTGRPRHAGKRCFFQTGLAGQNHLKMASGSYDMGILRELSRMEEEALQEIVRMFQVECEDSLPVSFDLHQLVGLKEGDRRSSLENMLKVCESDDTTVFIDKWLERIKGLDARVTDSICSTGPTAVLAKERAHQTISAVLRLE